jgi:hypothetical protein
MKLTYRRFNLFLTIFFFSTALFSQDERAQLPAGLRNAYFGVNIGSIDYNFSQSQVRSASGYTYKSVDVTHPAVRLVLYGYEFNKYLSAQLTYMRPVYWVFYWHENGNNNNTMERNSVWMNVGGLTLRPELPITDKISLYGEFGLGVVTRHGFGSEADKSKPYVSNANYATLLSAAGVSYHLNDKWRLLLSATVSPENKKENQPTTSFLSAGFNYKLQPISEKSLEEGKQLGMIHPKQWLQIGYTSNVFGYGINNSLESACVFWGGDAEVYQGLTLNYQRNIFHTKQDFSIDWGISGSIWQSKGVGTGLSNPNKENFYTLSIYPVARYNFLHKKALDAYFYYSVAGPTYISKLFIDGAEMGGKFTFQDNTGIGLFFGEKRNFNAEIKIGHYSNGNTFPRNAAVKVPLSINAGYAF